MIFTPNACPRYLYTPAEDAFDDHVRPGDTVHGCWIGNGGLYHTSKPVTVVEEMSADDLYRHRTVNGRKFARYTSGYGYHVELHIARCGKVGRIKLKSDVERVWQGTICTTSEHIVEF